MQLLYREELVPCRWGEVAQACFYYLPNEVYTMLYKNFVIHERREFYRFQHERLSKSALMFMKAQPPPWIPTNIDQSLCLLQQWIEQQSVGVKVTKSMNAITQPAVKQPKEQQQQQLQPIAQQQPTNVDSQVLGLLDMIAGGK